MLVSWWADIVVGVTIFFFSCVLLICLVCALCIDLCCVYLFFFVAVV